MKQAELEQILQRMMELGAEFGEVYIEQKESLGILWEGGKVDKISGGVLQGMGLRIRKDGITLFSDSSEVSLENALELVNDIMADSDMAKEKKISVTLNEPEKAVTEAKQNPKEVDFEEKIQLLAEADRACREIGEEISQVSCNYGEVLRKIVIANTEGVYTEEDSIRMRMSIQAIAREDGRIETGYASLGGMTGFELLNTEAVRELAEKAAKQAVTLVHARPCPGGKMPVILSSEAGGTMVHEACGHGLEGDLVQRGMSVYAGKLGEKVASEKVTVIDDGTLYQKYGSFAFDDEGHKARKNVLIENGILKKYLCDAKTAAELGIEATGSGRRESYQQEPVTRMSNTYIAPGTDSVEEMIESVEYGLFVKHMGGGQVDTITGNYVFDVSEGYLIENGMITDPVRGATLIGNGPETLMNIEMVGNDLGFAIGTCGKFGQGVPVGDAQPTLKIKELTVGGTVAE